MVGKGKKRREKNYIASHGGYSRLPPPPTASSIDALPNKLRQIMAFSISGSTMDGRNNNTHRKSKKEDTSLIKPPSKSEVDFNSSGNREERSKRSTMPGETLSTDANEDKKRKKRKRKQENDLRFEAELEKLGGISKRKQRKKEFLKAKKKKKKGKSEETLDLPKRDDVKFGDVVEAPPKLSAIPAAKKSLDASRERLRLQAIEAYRSRKGWTNRPGIQLPPVSTSSDLL